MPLTQEEASATLRDIESAEHRSSTAIGYRAAAPHLFLWGCVWMIGYGASYAWPQGAQIWPVLSVAGAIGSFWIGRRQGPARPSRFAWNYVGTLVSVFLFITAIFLILPPRTGDQVAAFFPLLLALFYALVGIWRRAPRILVLGAAIGALTIGGYFYVHPDFLLWMAGVGGGGLILGGLWLRTV